MVGSDIMFQNIISNDTLVYYCFISKVKMLMPPICSNTDTKNLFNCWKPLRALLPLLIER